MAIENKNPLSSFEETDEDTEKTPDTVKETPG